MLLHWRDGLQTLHAWKRSKAKSASLLTKTLTPIRDFCIDRLHQDLDILCLTPYQGGAEAIKEDLCQADDRFYTVRSANPKNTWSVLWWDNDGPELDFDRFKIDILVPGELCLPDIHPNYIINIELPCAPLHLLLFHKLKGWDDRRHSRRPDQRAKVPGDVRDIRDLLLIANRQGLNIAKDRPYITDFFRDVSYKRARKFIRAHTKFTESWVRLGLPNPTG